MNHSLNPLVRQRPLWLAVVIAGALLFSASPAGAHDAWVAPVAGPAYPIQYGHKESLPYPAHKVKNVQAFDAKGREIAVDLVREDSGVSARPASAPAMMTVFFDNGYYSRVDGKSRNVGKREAPGATDSSHPLKWGKTILNWSASSFEPLGQRLEIVPVRFDGQPKAAAPISVRVLLEGKPLAGATVTSDSGEQNPRTDAQGLATLKTASGAQRLTVEHRIPTPDNPDADQLALNASLVFVAR